MSELTTHHFHPLVPSLQLLPGFHSSLVPGHPHPSIQLQEIFSLANMSLTFGPSLSPVITNEVIAKLVLEKIPVISTSTFASKGMCKIPKALLSSQSSLSMSVSTATSTVEADWVEVPVFLHSNQTYKFIGFKEDVARQIWERFLNMPTGPNQFEADFLDMALAHIDHGTSVDAVDESDNWFIVMDAIGIEANSKPQWTPNLRVYIRLTETPKHWLKETVTIKFSCLEDLNDRIKKKLEDAEADKKPNGEVRMSNGNAVKPISSNAPIAESSTCSAAPTSTWPRHIMKGFEQIKVQWVYNGGWIAQFIRH
jgi:hypothetical protein